MDLNGNTFIVTGGASGLGAATVRALAAGGARVVIADLKDDDGRALATTIGTEARFVRTDVTDETSATSAVQQAVAAFGGVHGLVNCAGIVHGEKVIGREGPHTLAGFRRAVEINLIGTFNMTRLAADVMAKGAPNAEGERGVIVNTASVAAFDGQIGQAAYSASKAALSAFMESLAVDLDGTDIKIHLVNPGIIDTELFHLPDNEQSLADLEALPVEALVDAVKKQIAEDTFEIYVPDWFTDIVANRYGNLGSFIEGSKDYTRERVKQMEAK